MNQYGHSVTMEDDEHGARGWARRPALSARLAREGGAVIGVEAAAC